MEFKEFLKSIKKYSVVIIILIALGALSGNHSTRYFSSGYHYTQVFILTDSAPKTRAKENIKSENFFSQEETRNFTDTAVAILESPDFQSLSVKAGDSLLVRKLAPQVIRLTYVSSNIDTNNSQLQNIADEFNTRIETLTPRSQTSQLKAIGSSQPPGYSSLNALVLSAAGAVLGAVFALFVIGLKNYLKI